MSRPALPRRTVLAGAAAAAGLRLGGRAAAADPAARWQPRYLLASAMYGGATLAEILPEVAKTGADTIDLWPPPHGTQRPEIDTLGEERVRELLDGHRVRLGAIACYRLGPFNLADEFRLAARLGGPGVMLVTGAPGQGGATGAALKTQVREFLERLAPTIAAAEATGGVLVIENHSSSMIVSPDAIRWFGELATSDRVGVALAPHHLPQDGDLLAALARDLGPKLKLVYAQQHGKGSKDKLPKDDELQQMPGRGPLDFGPLMRQLAAARYVGALEIFMHPVPRGVPILESIPAVTAEINRARSYLEGLLG
jgi:sugar phosphate isomerase/epimerase